MNFIIFNSRFIQPVLAKELGTLKGFGGYVPESGDTGSPVGATITKIFSNFFGIMTIVGGIMFFVYFLLGALGWITSSGKTDKVQKAKDKMISAAIGLIAVIAVYGISVIVGKIIGVDILNPAYYIVHFWD